MMSTIVHYYAKRAFDYGKIHIKQGDEWFPEGKRNDENIISCGIVRIEREAVTQKPPRKLRVKNAENS